MPSGEFVGKHVEICDLCGLSTTNRLMHAHPRHPTRRSVPVNDDEKAVAAMTRLADTLSGATPVNAENLRHLETALAPEGQTPPQRLSEAALTRLRAVCEGLVDHGYAESLGDAAAKLLHAANDPISTPSPFARPEVAGSQHATTDGAHGRGAGDGVGL